MKSLTESNDADQKDIATPPKPTTPPEKPAADPKDKKPDPATPAPAAPADKPIRAKKKAEPARPALPIPAPAAAPVPAAAPAPAAAKIEDSLNEDELQMLEDSRDLEKLNGQKHGGLGKKTENYLREKQKRLAELKADGVDPETDTEFQQWEKLNQPTVTRRDYEQLRTHRVKEELRKEPNAELEEVKHQLFERDERPKIKKEVDDVYSELARTALPDEVNAEYARLSKEHGATKAWQMVEQSHKLEVEVTENVMNAAVSDVQLFKSLTRKGPTGRALVQFDDKNPDHLRISQMVADTCQAFKEAGGPRQIQDGKWFVTRDEWNALPLEQRRNFWTFTDGDLIRVAMGGVKPVIMKSIEAKRKSLEALGFTRAPRAAAPAAPAPAPTPTAPSAAPRPSPIPSPSSTNPSIPMNISSMASRLSAD